MIRRLGLSVLAAQAFLLAEVVLVLALEHRRVASIWEGEMGVMLLAPSLLALGLVLGVAGFALAQAFGSADRVATLGLVGSVGRS